MKSWNHGIIEVKRHGSMGKCKLECLEFRSLVAWMYGNMETSNCGVIEAWKY